MERKVILEWAKVNLVPNNVKIFRTEINAHIEFSNSGIKEAINQPHSHYILKNRAIYDIISLLQTSEYIGSAIDLKGRCLSFHYFKIPINGEESFAVIKENYDNTFKFYSIVDKLK